MSIPLRSNVLPKIVAIVRTCKAKRSEALQVLSMATDWSPPLIAKANQPRFAWCRRHGANRMAHLPKGRHFRHRMKYDKSEVAANICEPAAKNIRWLYFCKRQPAFGRAIEQITV